ncbi:uncharacterized protein LOC110848199 [Folsomia candida]|nr:uncharacterized protein LOC110848199 [Folsomia candida]
MEERLEKSTLRMLKAEKSFVNTARIIAGVVDDFAGEYETPDDAKKSSEPHENSEDHVILFRDDMLKSSSIAPFRERMNQIFDERMTSFQDGLTDDVLKVDKRFKNLQRQIRYGKKDAERSKCTDALDDLPGGGGDVPDFQNFEEFQDDRRTAESEEDDDYDDAILPTMDPLSREPIKTAVTNKFCHHVYDLESITGLIRDNSEAKCPVEGCKNEVALKFADLIVQPKLTEQIRTKNDKLYGRSYNHTHLINHLISL